MAKPSNRIQALFAAIQNSNVEQVKQLLVKGVALDDKNANGQTALTLACSIGNPEIIQLLISAEGKANLNPELLKFTPQVNGTAMPGEQNLCSLITQGIAEAPEKFKRFSLAGMSAKISDVALSWDMSVRQLWPESYPQELSNKLISYGVQNILDCAGGTGYPSIELKKMGWNITYSDGSRYMLDFFKIQIDKQKLDIPFYLARWENLSECVPDSYDAILCRGNSFLCIVAYDEEDSHSFTEVIDKMKSALHEFYKLTNDNGVLYIDLPNVETGRPEEPYQYTETDSKTYEVTTLISYNKNTNKRKAAEIRKSLIDQSEVRNEYELYTLSSEELIQLMLEAGYSRVEKSDISTAFYVDAFFGIKE